MYVDAVCTSSYDIRVDLERNDIANWCDFAAAIIYTISEHREVGNENTRQQDIVLPKRFV